MYEAKIIKDSVAKKALTGELVRLTTMQVCFPRFILAEFNTHRVFSRNSASSRAIPVKLRLEQVRAKPFIPEAFTKNQRGMQASDVVDDQEAAIAVWLQLRDHAVKAAEDLVALGVHKQHANRVLELFSWHTVVVTATEWDNFMAQRTHAGAQPEMQIIANLMYEALKNSEPTLLTEGEWHLPYADDPKAPGAIQQSVVRCAAVSYERQDVERTFEEVVERHNTLKDSAHWSPLEHQAQAIKAFGDYKISNLAYPWLQYRKKFAGEAVFRGS